MIFSPVGCANTKYKQRETEKYVLSNILSRTTETPEDQPDPADSSLWTNLSSSSAPALCDHISWELLHDNLHFTLQEYLLYFLPRKVSSYQNVLSSSSVWPVPGHSRQSNVDLWTTGSIVSSLETVRAQFVKDLPPITEIL